MILESLSRQKIFFQLLQVIATCICLSLSAYVTLALHFLPKLYIILLQPHKNDRSFFTTASKDVRCHIGRGQSNNGTKASSKILSNSVTNNSIKYGLCNIVILYYKNVNVYWNYIKYLDPVMVS